MKNIKPTLQSFTLLSFLIFSSLYVQAQNTFRYQAVARDTSGVTISNQLIGIQISIIQTEATLPAIYEEVHQVMSNDYGVINLNVGDGVSLLGDFTTIDWSLESFVQIEMDINGGTNYDLSSLSEILSVPRALYAERAGSISGQRFGLNVKDFGATGDGSTDDIAAFELALDSAKVLGSKLFVPAGLYRITRTLVIEDGVSLIGEGSGNDPLETPVNGSLLWYEGDAFAIQVEGHSSRIKDLVIRDKSDGDALGGILLEADGRLLESVHLSEILISGFTEGTGLKLSAKNQAGISYSSFDNVRVRHGKTGIHIDPSSNSFINSNSWNDCQVSGGGFDYGIRVDGGNNNTFNNVVIEPYFTNQGHLVVNKGEISGLEIRIEGTQQVATTPLIYFAENTKNSTLTGIYGGGLTIDRGNNFINMTSGKAIHYRNSSTNKFKNSTFFSSDNTTVKDWEILGAGVSVNVLSPTLTPAHNVLEVTIPAGINMQLKPNATSIPIIKDLPLYDQANFGFHVKSTESDIAYTVTNAPTGWTTSTAHSGSGNWEFIGMNAVVNRSAPSLFMLHVNNTTGQAITVLISTPTLAFGNQVPTLEESPLSTSGGELTGMLSHAMVSVSTPSNGFLSVPLTANYFEITNVQNIYRVNHLSTNRAAKGTVITLLFDNGGVGVTNGAYLNLKDGFTSVANGSLTLISNGNGTWREVNRNN